MICVIRSEIRGGEERERYGLKEGQVEKVRPVMPVRPVRRRSWEGKCQCIVMLAMQGGRVS